MDIKPLRVENIIHYYKGVWFRCILDFKKIWRILQTHSKSRNQHIHTAKVSLLIQTTKLVATLLLKNLSFNDERNRGYKRLW